MVERAALDTNRLSDLLGGDIALAGQLEHYEQLWLPFVVLAEMRCGILNGTLRVENEAKLAMLLRKPLTGVLYADRATVEQYARLQAQLKRARTPIPSNNIWIAALALQHDLRLITRDQHFQRIPQLLLG